MEMFNQYQFIGCTETSEEANTVLFGAPYDGTSSFRPGSRFGASRIRIDSYGLETYSPYLERDLEQCQIYDAGDIDLTFGNRDAVLSEINEFVKGVIKAGQKPLMIGGEHLVTLPAIQAVHEKHSDLVVLHFDAHADLRAHYLGEKLSHATVIGRVWDLLGDDRIYQFGIRSGTLEEFQWSAEGHTFMDKFGYESLDEIVEKVKNKPVYVTIDLDVLDPSIFPGTGTPEPGGISFTDMMKIIQKVSTLNVVGADIVELAPDYDPTGVSTAVASKVIREMLLVLG